MCVGVTVWFGWGGVVSLCRLKHSVVMIFIGKGKAVQLQVWTGPDGSRKLRFPDFVTTAQDDGRLSALRTGRLYTRKYS